MGGGLSVGFALVLVTPISENTVRLTFTEPPHADGVGGVADALDDQHYSVVAVSGTGLDGNVVRSVLVVQAIAVAGDALSIDVVVDRPFSPYPCVYRASCTGLRSDTTGLPLTVGGTSAAFHGLLRTVESQSRELAIRNRDVATPQSPAATMDPLPDPLGAVLGSFNPDSTGDYSYDEGLTGYRKRNLRRTYCRKRKFVFLPPDWGAGIVDELKRTNSADKREEIRADIEAQWLQDPETRECTVTVATPQPSVVRYTIQATTRDGRSLSVNLPFSMG